MLNRLLRPGLKGFIGNYPQSDSKDHCLEYIIDTSKPSQAPKCKGDADLWVNMQNMYYAEVNITKEFIKQSDPKNIHVEVYDMDIHCDLLLPYDRIAVTFQQALAEVLGPANKLVGTIKVYRKTKKYLPKEGWTIVKETPMLNIHQKL